MLELKSGDIRRRELKLIVTGDDSNVPNNDKPNRFATRLLPTKVFAFSISKESQRKIILSRLVYMVKQKCLVFGLCGYNIYLQHIQHIY